MAVDKTKYELDFQANSRKIFEDNESNNYNDNDISFLRKLNELYGDAMNAKGLNVADPLEANMFHYNKMGFKGNVDQPRVNRTYIFFTRPELNFSFENIQSVPFFKWLYAQPIGKMIFASLTDPEYFINAPTAFNTRKISQEDILKYLNAHEEAMKSTESTLASSSSSDGYKDYGLSENSGQNYDAMNPDDDQDDAEELRALPLDSMAEDSALDILAKNAQQIQNAYNNFYKSGSAYNNLKQALSFERDVNGTNNAFLTRLQQNNLYQAKSTILSTDSEAYWNTTPFIPLLSNLTTSVDGAKDFNLESYTYEEDEHGASLSVPTGMDSVWKEGDFNSQIEDIIYSPAALMMMTWLLYIHYVSRGYITPTREHITERILDYTCSAYIFVIGEDGRRIERFGKFTGCYPTSFPLSQQLLHNNQIDPDMLHKFSISWHFNRYTAMDPQIFTDFNFLSETEWLVKLKEPFWENLYTRGSESTINGINVYDTTVKNNEMIVESFGRPKELWDLVTVPGMAGKLPAALVPNSGNPNNFWGGYPYILNGREFIWVRPNILSKIPGDPTDTEKLRKAKAKEQA